MLFRDLCQKKQKKHNQRKTDNTGPTLFVEELCPNSTSPLGPRQSPTSPGPVVESG